METLKPINSMEELEQFMQTEKLEDRLEMVQVLFLETDSENYSDGRGNGVCYNGTCRESDVMIEE